MSTSMTNSDTISYPAPNGWSDFHTIAETHLRDHPAKTDTGSWFPKFRGDRWEFTWVEHNQP